MDGLAASAYDEHAPDVFATSQPPSISSLPDRQESVASITVQTSNYGGAAGQRGLSSDGSEDASPASGHNAVNSLDETIGDEFGLTAGPSDGLDLGAKSKSTRPMLHPHGAS